MSPVCPTCEGAGWWPLPKPDAKFKTEQIMSPEKCPDCSGRGWVLDEAALEKSWVEFWRTLAASVEAYEVLHEELKPLTPLEQQQRLMAYLEHKEE